jgi:hypothetical protein
MRDALEKVCGIGGRASMASIASIDVGEIQYALKPAAPDAIPLGDEFEVQSGMSPRTALLAGLLLGVTVMIGILGAIAWRVQNPEADPSAPATSVKAPLVSSSASGGP